MSKLIGGGVSPAAYSGSYTPDFDLAFRLDGTPVPEPLSLALVASAFGLRLVARRR